MRNGVRLSYLFSGPAVAQASRLRKWRQASRLLVNGPSGNRDGCGTIASEDACATVLNRYARPRAHSGRVHGYGAMVTLCNKVNISLPRMIS